MARSLSLVSRAFYDASRSLRLQSVRCDGLDKIIVFASILDKTPPSLRVVRHLFVTSYEMKNASQSLFRSVTASLRRSPRRKADRENEAHASLLRILTIIAPTLQTLAFHIHVSWAQLPFPPSLPALVELSIKHPFYDGYLHDVIVSISTVDGIIAMVARGRELTGQETDIEEANHPCFFITLIKYRWPSRQPWLCWSTN